MRGPCGDGGCAGGDGWLLAPPGEGQVLPGVLEAPRLLCVGEVVMEGSPCRGAVEGSVCRGRGQAAGWGAVQR